MISDVIIEDISVAILPASLFMQGLINTLVIGAITAVMAQRSHLSREIVLLYHMIYLIATLAEINVYIGKMYGYHSYVCGLQDTAHV